MVKKRIVYFAALLMMITGVLGTPVICHGEENSDLIAGDDERAAQQTVGEEGAEPVYAENLLKEPMRLRWIPAHPCFGSSMRI